MTLAAILLHVSLLLPMQQSTAASAQLASANQPPNNTAAQDQSNSQGSPQSTSSTTPAASPQSGTSQPAPASASPQKSGGTQSTGQKPTTKKKVVSPNCDSPQVSSTTSATASPAGSNHPNQTATTAGTGTNETVSKTSATNCPPQKITIVRQGSAKDASIELVGGVDNSGDTAKYLQSADDNLKKLAGQQLNSSQQTMVTQVHQFIDQSKKATATGDVDSARTLAWKAQLLSDELVNPQK